MYKICNNNKKKTIPILLSTNHRQYYWHKAMSH